MSRPRIRFSVRATLFFTVVGAVFSLVVASEIAVSDSGSGSHSVAGASTTNVALSGSPTPQPSLGKRMLIQLERAGAYATEQVTKGAQLVGLSSPTVTQAASGTVTQA